MERLSNQKNQLRRFEAHITVIEDSFGSTMGSFTEIVHIAELVGILMMPLLRMTNLMQHIKINPISWMAVVNIQLVFDACFKQERLVVSSDLVCHSSFEHLIFTFGCIVEPFGASQYLKRSIEYFYRRC